MMTKSKTVVIWGREDILSSSVELFLTTIKGWNVVSISNEEGFDALILAVETIDPEVVILHQGEHTIPTHLPMQLLQDHPGIKVITINLENNSMEVYSKRKVWVKETADLISVMDS